MSVNRTSLGKRISFYRSKSNLTQETLAAKVNCSREYIVQIENGTKVPSLFVLVESMGVDVQRGGRRHMAQHGGEGLHIHAVLQRQRCEGMP